MNTYSVRQIVLTSVFPRYSLHLEGFLREDILSLTPVKKKKKLNTL